jgi:hypothetical protein
MQIIPLIDLREGTLPELLDTHRRRALALIEAGRRTFGRLGYAASLPLLPLADRLARKWLEKTSNPYRSEIAAFAARLRASGLWALNMCYEFGCTSGVYATSEGPVLLRVLDWPFEGLGKHMVVAQQSTQAGEFYNVTWPGLSGVFTAMAPGRFAVALNQAPMRRFRTGIHTDWLRGRMMVWKSKGLPPAHLLRKVCETARDYDEARLMLLTEPICIPVIYVLAGTAEHEGCVIERLEEGAALREMKGRGSISAANHFLSHINGLGYGWRPREVDSCGRAVAAGAIQTQEAEDPEMGWFTPPIANHNSRMCFSGNAATGALSLMGTQGEQPVTELLKVKP